MLLCLLEVQAAARTIYAKTAHLSTEDGISRATLGCPEAQTSSGQQTDETVAAMNPVKPVKQPRGHEKELTCLFSDSCPR